MEFRLSDSFLEQYKTATPDWGPLGEFVYLRTYSRKVDGENRNEQWWETVRRVVEGVFSVQKTHCHNLNLPWKNDKAQKSAQLMFRKMFEFKFLPSGRNLWMMGTDFVREKGGTALLNCSFVSTEDIKEQGANIFSSMMDLLMLGVGAGFDTKGADKLLIKSPKSDGVFVIPDEREGWVESVRILLDAFFNGKGLPTFDYSLIRPAGAPIRGFGGTASGPGPLIQLHKNLEKLLTGRVGQMLSSVDIVDIENFISVCVIAGNVRRSAAIAIGEASDYNYVTMKDYNLHPAEVGERRWGSNNSVFAEVGKTDYKALVDSIALNGEPGIVWLDNMQKYSRTIDPPDNKDYDAKGTNACQPAWAKVLTPEGIRTLAEMDAGSLIWSKDGWTTIVNKQSAGIKPVYKYQTTAGAFYGTSDHRVISDGKKIEVGCAETIEQLVGPVTSIGSLDVQDIMDGLVLGDGSVHKASGNLVILHIGHKDTDYFDSDIANLIKRHRPGVNDTAYEIVTTITADELPKTYDRTIPHRYMASYTKMAGFLRGLYSANGSIAGNRVTLKATSKDVIEGVQAMLSALGIRSYYTTNKSRENTFSNGTYVMRESYDLNITHDRKRFMDIIGFIQKYKVPEITETHRPAKLDYDIVGAALISEEETFDITVDNDSHTYWTNGCNVSNCGEISLQSKEFCNLVETFPSRHDSYEEYEETLKMAYLYGKSVTLIPTHLPDWNAVMLKNRRIGVSMSGIIDAFGKHGRRELLSWCDKGYGYIQKLDAIYSDWLCIPRSRKTTTVKPSGSVSLLPGVSPGIHYPHAEYYIRRVRVAKTNGIVLVMKVAGYTIEEDAVDPSTVIIEFPVHEEYFLKSKEDATIWEQCKNVVDLQRHWADNNVSVTVTFNAEERGDIVSVLEAYEDSLKTISFLPLSEHGYAQAPYEEISKEQYEEMTKNLSKPDFSSITSTPIGSKFCDGDSCELR